MPMTWSQGLVGLGLASAYESFIPELKELKRRGLGPETLSELLGFHSLNHPGLQFIQATKEWDASS